MVSTMISLFVLSSLIAIQTVHSMDTPCANNGQSCTPLTRSEKEQLLDLHNELRDRVAGGALEEQGQPKATNMNSLLWDAGLEAVAQAYAETCPGFNHNPNRGAQYLAQRNAGNVKWGPDNEFIPNFCEGVDCIYIGENIISGGSTAYTVDYMTSVIEYGWWDEYKVWTFGAHNAGCQSGRVCGHYTQMVWANTRYVGCGYSNGCGNGNFFVCNYWPPGNFNNIPPYEAGPAATDCMSDRTPGRSMYETRSINSVSFQEPFDALCGGGICPTACDGASYNVGTCDLTGCDGSSSNTDCNDGTRALNRGRDICSTQAPTGPTPAPVTPAPITPAPITPATPAPVITNGCCTHRAAKQKWINTCPTIDNEADCLSAGRNSCEWVSCDTLPTPAPVAPGECAWDGVGRNRDTKCAAITSQSSCDNKSFKDGSGCEWVTSAAALAHIFELNEEGQEVHSYYDNMSVQSICLLVIIVGAIVLCLCKYRGNAKTKRGVNGGIIYGAMNNDVL